MFRTELVWNGPSYVELVSKRIRINEIAMNKRKTGDDKKKNV